MFGPKITTVFQSRWKAVMWSLGILATAYCSIPAADETSPRIAEPVAQHHSPWDKDH